MKKKARQILILFLFLMGSFSAYSQQSILSSGGNGSGVGGTFSFSLGQFTYHTYFNSKSSVAEGVQHPFDINLIPTLLSVSDTTIKDGEFECFNALQNIIIAGDGNNVVVNSRASTDFIAGESIRLLPGFHAQSGSSVHATITTNGNYCNESITPSIVQVAPETKSSEIEAMISTANDLNVEKQLKIYPNPNNGRFTINLNNIKGKISISVYNLTGAVFYKSELEYTNPYEINLPTDRQGIYFVRVINENDQFIKKIVIY